MRALIKTLISSAVSRTGAARILAGLNRAASRPLVLGYHRVVRDFAREARHSIPSMLVTTRMLEEHLDWIGRRFRFATLDEIGARLESGAPFEHPTAAITFDDGYADVYRNAFPMMRRKGIPAAMFVVSDLVGAAAPQQYDALYLLIDRALGSWHAPHRELAKLLHTLGVDVSEDECATARGDAFRTTTLLLQRLRQSQVRDVIARLQSLADVDLDRFEGLKSVDWGMLAEMRSGGFTIGSHTRSHPLLTHEGPACVADELRGSRRTLQVELGEPVMHLAYPDGCFNASVVEAAVAAGYSFAYTICRHHDLRHPLMTIPRRILWEKSCVDSGGLFSADVMECQIAGAFDFMAPCNGRHDEAIRAARTANSLPAYEHVEDR